MKPIVVRGVTIGEGIPKVCVSLTSTHQEELVEDAIAIVDETINYDGNPFNVVDLVEWRADHYLDLVDSTEHTDGLINILTELRHIIGDKPLIFTFRTSSEGGAASELDDTQAEPVAYMALLKKAIATGLIDIVDVELFKGDAAIKELVDYAHARGVAVIASNHDFKGTPKLEEIVLRLRKMQDLGADILKVGVMPSTMKDVLTLLEATVIMCEHYAVRPIVTIAMSNLGAISRVVGEVFGSSITFGQMGKLSAPGQIKASELSEFLKHVHNILPFENKL